MDEALILRDSPNPAQLLPCPRGCGLAHEIVCRPDGSLVAKNPETASQLIIRRILKKVSARWRTLQQSQRAAWITAAQLTKTHTRLNQNGPLTGA